MPKYRVTLVADFVSSATSSEEVKRKVYRIIRAQGWDDVNFEVSVERVKHGQQPASVESLNKERSIMAEVGVNKGKEKLKLPPPPDGLPRGKIGKDLREWSKTPEAETIRQREKAKLANIKKGKEAERKKQKPVYNPKTKKFEK